MRQEVRLDGTSAVQCGPLLALTYTDTKDGMAERVGFELRSPAESTQVAHFTIR